MFEFGLVLLNEVGRPKTENHMIHSIGSQQARQTKELTVSVVAPALLAIVLSSSTAAQEEPTPESADGSVVAHYTSCVPAPESLAAVSAVPAADYDLGYPRCHQGELHPCVLRTIRSDCLCGRE